MQVIKKSDWKTTNWSGGTTTELFIYPERSSFVKADYDLRISLATVETPTSSFTPLDGVTRTLMVLEGEQLLEHNGHHTADLKQFNQDTFSGNWETKCAGLATNFNVMCKNNEFVRVQSLPVLEGMKGKLDLSDTLVFLYVKDGSITIDGTLINTEECVILDQAVTLEALEDSIVIEVVF